MTPGLEKFELPLMQIGAGYSPEKNNSLLKWSKERSGRWVIGDVADLEG